MTVKVRMLSRGAGYKKFDVIVTFFDSSGFQFDKKIFDMEIEKEERRYVQPKNLFVLCHNGDRIPYERKVDLIEHCLITMGHPYNQKVWAEMKKKRCSKNTLDWVILD